MARPRTMTQGFEGLVGEPLSEISMDGFLSSSWPAAAPPTMRPQPPRAPLRKPALATWEVPAFLLPTAPKKQRASLSGSASPDASTEALESFDGQSEEDEEDEDDLGIFALEGAEDDDYDDAFSGAFDMGLVGLDDADAGGDMGVSEGKGFSFGYVGHEAAPLSMGLSSSMPMGRFQYESANDPLGASPMLMCVLEQVAHARANERTRADSF